MTVRSLRLLLTLLVLLLAASVAILVRQGQRIMALEAAIADGQVTSELTDGLAVPPLKVRDVAGHNHTIGYGSQLKPRLIYVFRPSCVVCVSNDAGVNRLARRISGKFEIVGLSLERDGLASFIQHHNLRFPVYTDISPDAIEAYRLGSTPETIVVSAEGRVIRSWTGD